MTDTSPTKASARPTRSRPRTKLVLALSVAAGLAVLGQAAIGSGSDEARIIPPPAQDVTSGTAVAVLAGGCFWGVQAVFQHLDGVTNAVSGYAGGTADTADYDKVSRGRTGHAEAVRITYDPARISYGRILQVFFSVAHDPTQLDRQGPDRGPQYRSALFPQNPDQAAVARAYIAQLDGARAFPAKIATRIEPAAAFYPAEAYHQDYMARNPHQPYIVINDAPKVAALKRIFPDSYRADPVLVASAAD